MSQPPNLGEGTLASLLAKTLRDHASTVSGEAPPVAILWTDPGRAWEGVIPALRQARELRILTLGEYQPDSDIGPAIWVRWVLDRSAPGSFRAGQGRYRENRPGAPAVWNATLQSGTRVAKEPAAVPVVYLPGVAREDLRAGERCPEELRPLVELLYRGKAWFHENGKDWTPAAFLGSSKHGPGLDLARDRATREALARALPELMGMQLVQLRNLRLDADFFYRLRVKYLRQQMLRWMEDPDQARHDLGDRWEDFRARSRRELDFDPGNGVPLEAGRRLAGALNGWDDVWTRYAATPEEWPGIEETLTAAQPSGPLFMSSGERWPKENVRLENELREAIADLSPTEAHDPVIELEKLHARRRAWVWSRLGRSPLARALEPLARLAEGTKSAIGGTTPEECAAAYRERGWRADAAVWEAIAAAGPQHEALVGKVAGRLLRGWLDDSARAFQEAVRRHPLPGATDQALVEANAGGCLFFVDALRYDLGQRLAKRLREKNLEVAVGHRWSALPTVTATAKPTVTPLATSFEPSSLDESFAPRYRTTGKPLTAAKLREKMKSLGYQIIENAEAPVENRGWAETGEIDHAGHDSSVRFPERIPRELARVADRIRNLLDAGWRSVRVVTDHGFLLLPGGLPRVDLPKHLTETRWARCAVLSGGGDPGVPRFPWSWNAGEWFATPPGIACFNRSPAFAHGGVSLQECLTPDLLVTAEGADDSAGAAIESVTWTRLRCVVVTTGDENFRADLRLGGAGGVSATATGKAKALRRDGTVALFLDEDHEDDVLTLVLLEGDQVVAMRETRAGENS